MQINTQYISNNNTYSNNTPTYIVIHNTDNYNSGANAKAHALAQYNGNFSDMSAHWYTDDGDVAYQAAPHNRGCWHVGRNYGGRLYGIAHNRNSVGIEMCVNAGYDYEKAFQNTVKLCKYLMKTLNVDAEHVIQHYDACAKNCPSAIRAKGDWTRFKQLISNESTNVEEFSRTNSGTCTGNDVNIRRTSTTNDIILGKLNKGNRFDVDGQISNGWYHIHIKNDSANIVGWIYGDYVQLDKIEIETPVVNTDPSMPFTDVHKNDFYYDAVKWAVESKITTGISPTQFAPLNKCTRADAIVLIWRMVGCPEPTAQENPFTDVVESDYYYKAVIWAVEKGITVNTGDKFSPLGYVTRGQFVTFLYRLKEKPDCTVENPFSDLQENAYYHDAVLWAYENKITTGYSDGTFSPDKICVRGEIITFLYRTK